MELLSLWCCCKTAFGLQNPGWTSDTSVVIVNSHGVTGFHGVVPRTLQLLHCALTEIDELSEAVTTINMETSLIDTCRKAMEQVRLLHEGLTLIQGVMRMQATGENRIASFVVPVSEMCDRKCVALIAWHSILIDP